jgi:hypothetical protein
MADILRHFKVWDPTTETEQSAHIYPAYGPAEAAEQYAAQDDKNHRYENGHTLCCRASEGEFLAHVYYVEVKGNYQPRYRGRFVSNG